MLSLNQLKTHYQGVGEMLQWSKALPEDLCSVPTQGSTQPATPGDPTPPLVVISTMMHMADTHTDTYVFTWLFFYIKYHQGRERWVSG